jgi:hypothetical protein
MPNGKPMPSETQWEPEPGLVAMLEKARAQKLWFYCAYQNLWFSPDKLEQHWKDDRFRWGSVNWQLRPRRERLAELDQELKTLEEARARVAAEVAEDAR